VKTVQSDGVAAYLHGEFKALAFAQVGDGGLRFVGLWDQVRTPARARLAPPTT
jgi:hypothetical protein